MRCNSKWRAVAVLIAACTILIVTGCLPEDMPTYLDGGKSIAAVAAGKLWVYDVPSGKVKGYVLPEHMTAGRMLGDQLWVHGTWDPDQGGCWRFDWATKKFVAGPEDLAKAGDWVDGAVPATWQGRKAVLILANKRVHYDDKYRFDVYSFPEFKKVKTVEEMDTPIFPAGDFWRVEAAFVEKGKKVNVEVVDADGKPRAKWAATEPFDWEDQQGRVRYARIGWDQDVLLWAQAGQGSRFDIWDLKTSQRLWGGDCEGTITGNPLIKRDAGWLLRRDEDAVVLTRCSQPETANGEPTLTTLVKYPLAKDDEPAQYNLSPDGKEFALVIDGPKPRLVFFPIREGVTAKDLRVVELKDSN